MVRRVSVGRGRGGERMGRERVGMGGEDGCVVVVREGEGRVVER